MIRTIHIYLLIISLALCAMLTACAPQAPCVNELWKIHKSHYVPRVNDCCDKACDYCNVLTEHGYDAQVVVGLVTWSRDLHAWVSIIIGGTTYWVDPVLSIKFGEVSSWRDRTLIHRYKRGVTPDNIRKYQQIIPLTEAP